CTVFGDGEQTRDFVYVDDVVDAFVRAADKGTGLLLNIGTGVETSVNELYTTMAGAAGVTAPARREAARPGELARPALDPGRAGAVRRGSGPRRAAPRLGAVDHPRRRRGRRSPVVQRQCSVVTPVWAAQLPAVRAG